MAVAKIVIYARWADFPFGGAYSSRVRLIARALVEAGADVIVLISAPRTKGNKHFVSRGVYSGFRYQYLSRTPLLSNCDRSRANSSFRRWDPRQVFKLVSALWRLKREGNLETLIICSKDVVIAWIGGLISRWLGVRSVLDCTEWPLTHDKGNWITQVRYRLFCNHGFHFIDAVLPISNYLAEKVSAYNQRTGRRIPHLLVPILTDVEDADVAKGEPGNYVLFCSGPGYLNLMLMVLRSYNIVRQAGHQCDLVFVGLDQHRSEVEILLAEAKRQGCAEGIRIPGYVSWDELKRLYSKAAALLIPLPDDERSRSRFPTKIGEYLSSARPVITTAVGDIGRYLQDGHNAFVARPGDIRALAERIQFVLENAEIATKVGVRGRETAKESFGFRGHGRRLLNFIETLRS
jgi:glycosyltransferase involved in cell wall biosynthesis